MISLFFAPGSFSLSKCRLYFEKLKRKIQFEIMTLFWVMFQALSQELSRDREKIVHLPFSHVSKKKQVQKQP
jgi:hypothetical protein